MEHVLIIEDEEYYGEFLKKIIGKKYPCDWARTAARAKELLAAIRYDIVLYDLRLPGSSGKDLIRYVREHVSRDIVNIVVTGYEDDWPAVEATSEHVFFYLRKGGFKNEDLMKVLESAAELARARRREEEYVRNLIAVERFATAGKLAVSIAHEINNPLQGMMSILDVLKKKTAGIDRADAVRDGPVEADGSRKGDLEILEKSIERIRRVVKQLTDLHSIDPSAGGRESLDAVVERAVSFIRPIAREKHTKISVRSGLKASVYVTEKQLFHVLLNTCMHLLDGDYETIEIASSKRAGLAVVEIRAAGGTRGAEDRFGSNSAELSITKSILQSFNGNIDVSRPDDVDILAISVPMQDRK